MAAPKALATYNAPSAGAPLACMAPWSASLANDKAVRVIRTDADGVEEEFRVNVREMLKEGDPLRITTQILDHDAKRLHYIHTMYHATKGYLAATNELMLMNIDYATRRSAPWPEWAMPRIEAMAANHRALPRPTQAGRLIGIKRKSA